MFIAICYYSVSKNTVKKSYNHLTTCDRHKAIWEAANLEYRKNAERMKLQYAKRKHKQVTVYNFGDKVTLRIPRSERSKTDMSRLCIGSEAWTTPFTVSTILFDFFL